MWEPTGSGESRRGRGSPGSLFEESWAPRRSGCRYTGIRRSIQAYQPKAARWARWHFVWGAHRIQRLSQPFCLPRSITASQRSLFQRIFTFCVSGHAVHSLVLLSFSLPPRTSRLSLSLSLSLSASQPSLCRFFFFCPSLLITLCLFSSITLIKIHMYVYPLLDPIYRCLLSLIRLNTLCLKMTFCVEKLWNYSLGLNSAVSSDCTLLP